MVEEHAIGRNSGCRLLIGFEHRRGPAAIEDAAIWRLVDDRLDVEDLAAAFAIQMQLDLADGVAVRCRNIFQQGSISSEERRVGKAYVSPCKSGWSPVH